MKGLIDFDKMQNDFVPFNINRETAKENIGKRICYVDYIEPYRGTYFIRCGTITDVKRGVLIFDDYEKEIKISKIHECGIEK